MLIEAQHQRVAGVVEKVQNCVTRNLLSSGGAIQDEY